MSSKNITTNNTDTESYQVLDIINIDIIEVILWLYLLILIICPIIASVLFKLIKPINEYIKSFTRLIKLIISDSVYELVYFQTLVLFGYSNFPIVEDIRNILIKGRSVSKHILLRLSYFCRYSI